MKIILIGTAYPHRGGIAHFNALLHKALAERGHQVLILSFKRQYPSLFFPGKTQFESGEAIPLRSEAIIDSIGPWTWSRTARRIREFAPDLVIFQHWMPFFAPAYGTIARLARRHGKTRIMYICHNIVPHERKIFDDWLTRYMLPTGDHFIVLSAAVEKDLLRYRPGASVQRVHHPVVEIFPDTWDRRKARQELGLGDENVVLFFGYIRRYKGLGLLLEAFSRARKEIPGTLVVAGEFYDDEASYREQIRRLGIEKDVRIFDEYIPNERVGLFFRAADVVALPYISATQSGIVQVCYHFDMPVIATDVGGLPEVVRDGETGFVVPAGDADAFAQALIRFFKEERARSFASAVRLHKKNFSWEHLARVIENFG